MSTRERIVVIGAGLVGSLLARLLALRGHEVAVYEKRLDPRTSPAPAGRSTHLVISERGWRALDAIGGRDVVARQTQRLRGRRIHGLDGGVTFQPYGEEGQAIWSIQRSTLNRIMVGLCAATPGVTVHFGWRCVGVDPGEGRVTLEEVSGGARRQVVGHRVFAADGAFSGARATLLRTECFDYSQAYERFGYKELLLPAEWVRNLEPDVMHAWPRGRVSLFAFGNPDGSFTATLLAPLEGPDSFGSLREAGDVNRLFRALYPDVPVGPAAEELLRVPVSTLVSIRCSPWTFGGRFALIGDAAHAMVPFLGQGMNAGFEDCTALGSLLDLHGGDFALALPPWERARKPNCDAVTEMSSRAFLELTERIADPRFLLRKQIEQRIHHLYPERFVPAYQALAFSHAPYEEVLRRAERQEVMAARLMAIPDIEQAGEELDVHIHAAMSVVP